MRFKNWYWSLVQLAVIAFVVALLCCPLLLFGQEPAPDTLPDGHPRIEIAARNRVQNLPGDLGVCWWASAEMVGRQYGIPQLVGLVEKVKADGNGWVGGAADRHIAYWHKKIGLEVRTAPAGKTQDAVAWIRARLDEGKPVICGVLDRGHNHAVLLTYLSYQPRPFSDGRVTTRDFVLRFIDCNHSTATFEQTWATFWDRYQGAAWAYDLPGSKPAQPDPAKARTDEPMHAATPSGPHVKAVDPKVLNRVDTQTAQFAQIINPTHVGVPGVKVDVAGGHPLVTGKVPSNQDIKDGVQRPLDTINNNAFGQYYFGGYDYYAEFKERVQRGALKPPAGGGK